MTAKQMLGTSDDATNAFRVLPRNTDNGIEYTIFAVFDREFCFSTNGDPVITDPGTADWNDLQAAFDLPANNPVDMAEIAMGWDEISQDVIDRLGAGERKWLDAHGWYFAE